MELQINVRPLPGADVIEVTGEVDIYTASELDQVLATEIAAGRTTLIVDCSRVEFLDSTGLGVIIKAFVGCREAGGRLAVVAPTDRISRVFEITGVDQSIRVVSAVDRALQSDAEEPGE